MTEDKDKLKKEKDSKKELPKKDTSDNKKLEKLEAILPNEKKRPEVKDTVKNE